MNIELYQDNLSVYRSQRELVLKLKKRKTSAFFFFGRLLGLIGCRRRRLLPELTQAGFERVEAFSSQQLYLAVEESAAYILSKSIDSKELVIQQRLILPGQSCLCAYSPSGDVLVFASGKRIMGYMQISEKGADQKLGHARLRDLCLDRNISSVSFIKDKHFLVVTEKSAIHIISLHKLDQNIQICFTLQLKQESPVQFIKYLNYGTIFLVRKHSIEKIYCNADKLTLSQKKQNDNVLQNHFQLGSISDVLYVHDYILVISQRRFSVLHKVTPQQLMLLLQVSAEHIAYSNHNLLSVTGTTLKFYRLLLHKSSIQLLLQEQITLKDAQFAVRTLGCESNQPAAHQPIKYITQSPVGHNDQFFCFLSRASGGSNQGAGQGAGREELELHFCQLSIMPLLEKLTQLFREERMEEYHDLVKKYGLSA